MFRTIYAEKQLFKGVGNYFTNAVMLKDEQGVEVDDGNEVDAEPLIVKRKFTLN